MADLTPLTPEWWIDRLLAKLWADVPRMERMDRYHRGDHDLPFVRDEEVAAEYRALLRRSKSNFMRVVIDAGVERQNVLGFRTGDDEADRLAHEWWDANGLDSESPLGFESAQTLGRTYLSVWTGETVDDVPRIAFEDARQTIVEHVPGDRRKRAAGLKVWADEWTGETRVNLYLPDALLKFRQAGGPTDQSSRRVPTAGRRSWELIEEVPNPFGAVTLIPLVNRPSLSCDPDGESEIDDVIDSQDRINALLFERGLAAWLTAYRQKWATGLEVPVDEQGQPISPFKAAIDQVVVGEDPATRFGTFDATDLGPYIEAIEQDVQHIAVQTRTPRHYFLQQGQSPSGDAIKSAEAGLVAKVLAKNRVAGRAIGEAINLARIAAGLDPLPHVEVRWADPEFRTYGELVDGVVKELAAGLITREMAMEKLGYTDSQVTRARLDRMTETLLAEAEIPADLEGPEPSAA